MKKAIIVSLLISVLAGGVFAQLTLSGEMYAGIQLEKNFVDDDDAIVSAEHRKEGAPMFNLTATGERENYGAKLDVTFQTTNPFSLNGIFAWADFLDNSLRLVLGKISDSVWISSLDADHEYQFDQVTGFRLEYKPTFLPDFMEGLCLGFAFSAEDYDAEKFFKKFVFGASYVNPMLNAVFSYDNGNNGRLLLGINYTDIPDLTSAGIQMRILNIASWDSISYYGTLAFNEKIGYRVIRPLTVSLLMEQEFYAEESKEDPKLSFTVEGAYKILPELTGSLSVGIMTADNFDSVLFTLGPCIEYTLKGPALLYAQYELGVAKYKEDSYHRFGFGIDIKTF